MMDLPVAFVRNTPPALVDAIREGAPVRGIRFRHPVEMELEPIPWAENAYYLDADSRAGAGIPHAAGAFYLQEPSAMAAATVLGASPGERLLDLCAAPGGKCTQIAAMLGSSGVLVANEIVPARAKTLSQNIERMGVTRAIVTNEPPDALAKRWGACFDRVLVDAPCSGEGMFRREPATRAEWTAQSPKGCAARQLTILRAAAELLLPGGTLVYSTCTFNRIENEGVVAAFLEGHADFAPVEFALNGVGRSAGGCLRLEPHRVRGEGHFVAKLQKTGKGREIAHDGETLIEQGGRLWLLPNGAPDLSGVRVLRPGLALGEVRGKTFIPDHALAMALSPVQTVRLNAPQSAAYLRGEAIPVPESYRGWAIASYGGYALGWGKCADGMMKNRLPKGLRRNIYM